MPYSVDRSRAPLLLAIVVIVITLLVAGAAGVYRLRLQFPQAAPAREALLLAPLVGVNDTCIEQEPIDHSAARPLDTKRPATLSAACGGESGSAAALIESTLAPLIALVSAQTDLTAPKIFDLGYTLAVPLLALYEHGPLGWTIDAERVARVARTLAQSPRPMVLYLFSTHFSAEVPIERSLAADPTNLAQTRDGPLATSSYYGAPLYNWSVTRTDNPLTARREEALAAVLDAVCGLAPGARGRVKAVTLLGETHQLFPDFEAGMGFSSPYRITDYSAASVEGFQAYLRQEFGTVAKLNRSLGSDYASFGTVVPPSRDIRTEPLTRYTEHIDAFAHGTLPIGGWAYVPPAQGSTGRVPWVHVYRDGVFVGRVRADRGRQDVVKALPEVQQADTGWRMDLDYRSLAPGLHRIDVLLEQRAGELTLIGSRQIAIMDARQQTPLLQPQQPLPTTTALRPGVQAHVDQPLEQASHYFNPLVPYWHAFRGKQVADYLEHFSQQVGRSCLANVPRYTHQIVPFSNPSWDENKFAIGQSLQRGGSLQLGISLYGDAAYGARFPAWLRATGHRTYGVTEFHPLRAMDAQRLRGVLDAHAADGAQFLSFFLEPRWQGELVPRAAHNPFSFDLDNPEFGSDVLYRSMQQVLQAD